MSAKPIVVGLLCGAGAIVWLAIPHKETFSNDGFGIFGRVEVKCGSVFGSNTQVDFDDFAEGQSYRNDVLTFGEPSIFEGKTATQVCDKEIKDARTTGLVAGGIGALLFIVGLAGRNKSKGSNFLPAGAGAPAPVSAPPPAVVVPKPAPTPARVDNPARWAADPFGRYELRHWNGKKWTEHVIRDGQQSVDPPRQTPVVPAPPSAPLAPPSVAPALAPPMPSQPVPQVVASMPSDALVPAALRPDDDDAHDGRTIQRPVKSQVPILTVKFSNGATVQTRATLAIGRRPSDAEGIQAVAVDDPTLSKSHLLVGIDTNGPWAQDTHSTNGVEMKLADGTVRRLTAGVRTPLPASTRLTFGDSWCELVNG